MKLYVDTRPNEPMDASTAERFREVEVPNKIEYNRTIPPIVDLHNRGFNTAIVALQSAIAKAKEQP